MNLKEHILKDIQDMNNPQLLHQCFEYIQVIKKTKKQKSNKDRVLQFAGI